RLRSKIRERLRSETREKTYKEIMLAHRDALTNLNISLCKECLYPIKLK
ncbi:15480_t:CDS:1, partial [Racocetra persica]